MSLLPVGISGEEAGYQISRSLRFNSADSAYLNRTPASAGNRKTWTWSGWVKRSALGTSQIIFKGGTTGVNGWSNLVLLYWGSSNSLLVTSNNDLFLITSQVFRDPSSWYHIVALCDTTQATASNRLRLFINGSEITAFSTDGRSTYISQNSDSAINTTTIHEIGRNGADAAYLNGYLTEVNFIDGSALDPTSFGEFNSDTGVWQPIKYTGTYGTNGFYLNFSDNTSTTTLGDDFSGNGNDWTTNNFSVTAGAGNDSLVDSPTRYGTDTGAGGEVRGNYATLNPLSAGVGAQPALTNGNLDFGITSAAGRDSWATITPNSGKWYWEVTAGASSGGSPAMNVAVSLQPGDSKRVRYTNNGTVSQSGLSGTSGTGSFASYTTNDVIGVAFDVDAKSVKFYKNNTLQTTVLWTDSDLLTPYVNGTDHALSTNFGQRPFAHTAPSGFKALCTTNLPEPTIADGGEYFNTVLYTGTGVARSVTGVGFQPDFVWVKGRSVAYSHLLTDSVRGVSKRLVSDSTAAEVTDTGTLTAFNSDGFSWGTGVGGNQNAATYVAWNWKANGAGVTNTDGTITSTVSVNTTSGFSIVTYTGTGSAATVGHGLGAVPRMIIVKNRDAADAWQVYHAANTANPETDYLVLNTTAATADAADRWNDTLPTSTVFSIGNGAEVNTNTEDYVAYCFAPVAGFSSMGSYVGNDSADGPFVYLGFRPRFVMFKNITSGGSWVIFDTSRDPYNAVQNYLFANQSTAENGLGSVVPQVDYLSNGFKLRANNANAWQGNQSGNILIYMAFAENPFAYSLAR